MHLEIQAPAATKFRGKMNVFKVFQDSQSVGGNQVIHVGSMGSANSVWLCTTSRSKKFVLKYFPGDAHGESHFKAEKSFLQLNQKLDFLPKIIDSNKTENYFALDYLEPDAEHSFSLDDLIEIVETRFLDLNLSYEAHEEMSGILNWWQTPEVFKSPIQNLIIKSISYTDWFRDSMALVTNEWTRDSIIHGDLKIQNLILTSESVYVIDWENVTFGPKTWDVAGLFQSVLVESFSEHNPNLWAQSQLQMLVSELEKADDLLVHSTALRLVQSAVELSSDSDLISIQVANVLQLAAHIAERNFEVLRSELSYAR
jgi:predicted Ser/Thr protein kinase